MNVQEALSQIHAPKGMTSVIAGVMSGDFDPIRDQSAVGSSLSEARKKLEAVVEAQRNCGSDWAWWGYQGDISYWKAVVSILEAADLVGADKLPDVPAPKRDGVVMDVCAHVERFGTEILRQAKESPAPEGLAQKNPVTEGRDQE